MHKILIFLWKVISYSAARWIYGPFSRILRFLFERKYEDLPTDLPWTVSKVLAFFKTCTWKSDPAGGVIDYISKPEKFLVTQTGDCDEYACFAANVIPWHSFILSVTFYNPKAKGFKKFQGHNVCVYFFNKKWYHIGNWGKFGPFDRPRDAWNSITPKDMVPCTYSIRKKDLKWLGGGWLKSSK